jgi:uncharacterized membrane protein YhaH (DUF805 family)
VSTPHNHDGGDYSARFLAPYDPQPRQDASAPVVPPNAYLRGKRGYTPAPVEEAIPSPELDPHVIYLRERSVETGEVHAPIDEVKVTHSMSPVNTMPKFLGAEYLQNWEERFRAREGSRIKRQLRFWTFVWLCGLFGSIVCAVLTRGLIASSGPVEIGVSYSGAFLILMAFATGMAVMRIQDYGWVPWMRLFFLTFSRKDDVVQWREGYGNAERVVFQRGKDAR